MDDPIHGEQATDMYEELCWNWDDVLEFVPDYKNNQIIVKNKTMEA